jgi:hypothetical protein
MERVILMIELFIFLGVLAVVEKYLTYKVFK